MAEGQVDEIPAGPLQGRPLTVGGSDNGVINTPGDRDGFAVELVAGQSYLFTLTGSGDSALIDPFLEIYGPTSELLAIDDDAGPDRSSLLRFTAPTTGTYYVNAMAWDAFDPADGPPTLTGGYTITAASGPPQNPLDTIDFGFTLPSTSISVYFAFAGETFNGIEASQSWAVNEISAAMAAMATFSAVTQLTFTQVSAAAGATFIMSLAELEPSVLGQFSSTGSGGFGVFDPTNSFWSASQLLPGGEGFVTLVHEVGHGLGLAHPHDNGGFGADNSSEIMQGVTGPFDDLGAFGLNIGYATIMSYNTRHNLGPGVLDIALLQQKYGVNTTTNSGDTVYDMATVPFVNVIWDTGGVDTIVNSNSLLVKIDLHAATLLNASGGGGFEPQVRTVSTQYEPGGFVIANGVVIENATGGVGDDVLIGNEVANILTGGDANDFLYGYEGADSLIGSDGADTAAYTFDPAGVHVDLQIQSATDGWGSTDSLAGIENIEGSAFDDILIGGAGFIGTIGGTAFNGHSSIYGLDGDDYIEDHALEHASLVGGAGNDRISSTAIRSFIFGGTGDDFLSGSYALRGEEGNDIVSGGNGDDFMFGGDGLDTLTYESSSAAVTVSLALIVAQNTFGAGVDTVVEFENVFGSAYDDTLAGDAGANVLDGSAGVDTLTGGLGDDTYVVDNSSDVTVELNNEGLDHVQTSVSYGLSNYVENLTLIGPDNINGSGNFSNNRIEGNAGNNVLDGGAGVDTLIGGLGDDTLIGGDGEDALDGGDGLDTSYYASAPSRVVVNLTLAGPQDTLGAGLDTLVSIENVIGSAFGDTLTGDAGNNVLSGGAGVDTLIGGLGDDTLIGGDNTDFIVDTSGIVSIDGGSGNEQITLGAAIVSGTVDGGVGTDQLTKGGSITGLTLIGIEILNTNGGTVTGTAAQFESFDTIRFSAAQPFTAVSLALAAAGTVDLFDELTGRRALFAGTSGNDTITTSTGSDQIDGGAGDDTLTGNAGNDTLIGGLGDDVLSGGVGTDFLVDLSGVVSVDGGDGDDVITLGAAINAGTVAGGLGTDQLNKGGAISGLTISGVEIVNTNGGTLLATAAQLEGFDTIRFSAAQGTTAVSLALSEAGTVDLTDELLGRRALFAGTSGNDVITTSNGSDQIDGGAGDDTLTGNAGVDTLIGGLGDDILNGGDGGDFLVDLSGIVAIDAGDGDDVLTVGAGIVVGTIAGGLGTSDQLNKSGNLSGITVSGIEIVNTNGGTLTATAAQLESFDVIRFSAAQATAAISLVQAGAGTADLTDELLGRRAIYQGSSDNDAITTSNGADRVDGGAGDDTLNGGLGNDTLTGGLGDDLIIQGSTDGRDLIDGGAGTDTYQLNGTAAAETFRIMTRAEALLAGITGLAGSTEIVITKDGTTTASVIAELDNVEEISINALLTTANNGNGAVDGGTDTGDTIIVLGDFTTTSLAYSTIHINGSLGNDTIDISGLTSAHRVVFASNGGSDTLVGDVRPQDVFAGMSASGLHLGAGIESDFQLMELINHQTIAAVDAFDDHSLMRSNREPVLADVTYHTSLFQDAHDPLAGVDTARPGEHQIAADYALLQA